MQVSSASPLARPRESFVFRAALASVAIWVVAGGAARAQVRVTQFAPQGTVKPIRQVTARFSEQMVPLGDPRGSQDPFEIECAEPGSGRWIDSRTWAYDFRRDLPAGCRCTFKLRSSVTSVAGTPVGDQQIFVFSSGGPAIVTSQPVGGDEGIEEEAAFVLVLDGEATEASLLEHVGFDVEGLPERIGIRLLSGEERTAVLRTVGKYFLLSGPAVVLQARQRFPQAAKVRLVWGAGVASPTGVATDADQVLEYKTRAAFSAHLHCDRDNAKAGCSPLTPLRLRFSAPVAWEDAKQIAVTGPDERRWTPLAPSVPAPFVDAIDFPAPFPERSTLQLILPPNLHDDAGRPLINAAEFPLAVKTDNFPVLAKFPARFGIIESRAQPALPVTVRNLEPEITARLERITKEPVTGVRGLVNRLTGTVVHIAPDQPAALMDWLRKVRDARRAKSIFRNPSEPPREVRSFSLPKPNPPSELEVIGIPFETAGLYVVELASPKLGAALLGKDEPMFVPAAALVTNLAAHFKWGRDNSLVWVTTLDHAQPVAAARVTIQDCRGTVLWSGSTDPSGIARVDHLPERDTVATCPPRQDNEEGGDVADNLDRWESPALNTLNEGLFVIAQTDGDLSFVHSEWQRGIEPWRFELPAERSTGPVVEHTILDRPLFRAGETVHMKHLLRKQVLDGFSLAAAEERPSQVSIRHLGSDTKFDMPVQWDATGAAETTWTIPRDAKLGQYTVVLPAPGKEWWGEPSAEFRVEEFRVPLMRGSIGLPTVPQVAVTEVPVDVSLQYLAGGAAANAPVSLRAQLRPQMVAPPDDFERFSFGNGAVNEGLTRRGYADEDDGEEAPAAKPPVHQHSELVMDGAGGARTTVTNIPPADTPRELFTEMEFRDPNGETQTVSSSVPLWPSTWLAGVRAESWASSGKAVRVQVAVIDASRRPVAGAAVRIQLLRRSLYSNRKRLLGGFYAYEHIEEVRAIGPFCNGTTDGNGVLRCEATVQVDGNLVLQATVTDNAGRASVAHDDVWVADQTDWRFAVTDSDRIDLLPEKRQYEPGETARLQVRSPFREATALVTTEREGILDAWVTHLSGKAPVIDVPIKDSFAPNMFVSAFVIRGRAGDVQPTAMVDLGRPAFKLGVAELRVGWGAHALKVAVSADKPVYPVRAHATVRVAVRSADGAPPPPGSEVALAAVDEGLLELRANTSWDVLDAMMNRRGYGVRTATAQMLVVGKRHFGRKALPHGGSGGRKSARELFDTLLLWQGRLALDGNGDATVDVPLNDALTSFRIVAIATGGVGQFGTGSASIRSSQDLMVLPGIAPLLREEDRARAEFTVRNASSRPMDVTVRGRIDGFSEALPPQTAALAPGMAQVVAWNVTVPAGIGALRYVVNASDTGGASDELIVAQRVVPAVPVRVLHAMLVRVDQPLRQPVERPADALPERGDVQVALAPTLTAGLDAVRQWMRVYPYSCLEQRVSRAVALHDEAAWRSIVNDLPSYQDGDGLLKYFPSVPLGSETLTAYVLGIAAEAGFEIPSGVSLKMVAGLRGFVGGTIARQSGLHTVDLSLRKLAAVDALARVNGADPGLLTSVRIEPNLWPTSGVLDWWGILSRLDTVPDRAARLGEAEQIVRSRLNLQGTTMGFSTEKSDELWWLMQGPDANAARVLLQVLRTGEWSDEVPRLVRGLLGRQRNGRWSTTVANAWGTLAVERFADTYEKSPVAGVTTAALGASRERFDWAAPPPGGRLTFPWPPAIATLEIAHVGTGAPWATVQARAAIPLREPLSAGYRITKTVTPIEPADSGPLRRGAVVRVRLEVEAQGDMTWVVVNDPIPAGASHLGTGLGRDSQLATQGEQQSTEIYPAFQERAAEALRAYYDFVPKGSFSIEYTMRLNQSGRFNLPPTRVEALYAPEMFGELPNAAMEIEP